MLKTRFLILFSLMMICLPVSAADSVSAEAVLKENLEAVFAVLQKEGLTQEAKNKEVVDLVSPMFDFPLMAKLTLGRKYWSDLTDEQKERFTRLFVHRLRTSYLDRLTLYTDEKVVYEAPVENNGKVQIPTNVISKDKKISILYKFYGSEAGWKIYDLEIQGVSIIRSYRAQFNQILQTGTFEDLLAKMEKPDGK